MATRIFDFLCAECGNTFEVFARSDDESQHCPRCRSPSTARQPVMQLAIHGMRRGRLIDMSSNSCPCGCAGGKHAKQ